MLQCHPDAELASEAAECNFNCDWYLQPWLLMALRGWMLLLSDCIEMSVICVKSCDFCVEGGRESLQCQCVGGCWIIMLKCEHVWVDFSLVWYQKSPLILDDWLLFAGRHKALIQFSVEIFTLDVEWEHCCLISPGLDVGTSWWDDVLTGPMWETKMKWLVH